MNKSENKAYVKSVYALSLLKWLESIKTLELKTAKNGWFKIITVTIAVPFQIFIAVYFVLLLYLVR